MSERLHRTLDVLWDQYGSTPDMEKSASAMYFYDLQAPVLAEEALGAPFCKLASATGCDPWYLADQVAERLESFEVLSKQASDPRVQELAQFYSQWADELEKTALFRQGYGLIKSVVKRAPKAATKPTGFSQKTTGAMRRSRRAKLRDMRRSQAHSRQQTLMQRQQTTANKKIVSGPQGGQSALKKRLQAKHQGAPRPKVEARPIPGKAPPQASPQARAQAKKGPGFGAKAIGTAALAAPLGLAGYYGMGMNEPSAPTY